MYERGKSTYRGKNRPRVNERIRAKNVRVVDPEGKQLGVLSTEDALKQAYGFNLDLVEIAPKENPPVCKIMNYGKYLYELKKKEKETKKKQASSQLKEVRFTSRIGEHDYQTKVKHIKTFLEHGHRVRISLMFRGREITHRQLGDKLIEKILEDIKDVGKVEFGPKMEGNFMILQVVSVGRRKHKD